MDAQALLTPDAVDRYMGVPLAHVPAPEGSDAASYARYFVGELFMGTFAGLGITPVIYWMSELYGDGTMDPYIRTALDAAERIRELYWSVSKVAKEPGWLPISVICESCGKIGTTLATAGGSRDRSDAISREVFHREPPLNVAYEFLNIGGRKMSTSKGTGATAHGIAELLPPELLRFLFLRHKPRRAIEFDPEGDTIPGLFDEFDRIAAAVAGRPTRGELPADPAAILRHSLIDADADVATEAARFRPPFRHLALLVQVPGVDVAERMAAEKGTPLDDVERAILDERVRVAREWLESFAPERYKVEVQEALPAGVSGLTEAQRIMLASLATSAEGAAPDSGGAWQDLIFGTSQTYGVSSGDAFAALYLAFLGRTNGPRAGWLLASLDRGFVIQRLRDAAGDVPVRTPSELAERDTDR
jgi:lysyl-tRNA synthetase class 1